MTLATGTVLILSLIHISLGVSTLAAILQLISLLLIAAGVILFFWSFILRNERGR